MRFSNVCLESLEVSLPSEVWTSAQIEERLRPLYEPLRPPFGRRRTRRQGHQRGGRLAAGPVRPSLAAALPQFLSLSPGCRVLSEAWPPIRLIGTTSGWR